MKSPAKIEITAFHDKENFKLINDGYVYSENNTTFIEYGESNDNKTCIGISNDLVSLNKIGEESYTMILEEGKTNYFEIKSNVGNVNLSVNSHKIKTNISNNIIDLFLSYSLSIDIVEVITKLRVKCTLLN